MRTWTWGELKSNLQKMHGIETDQSYDEQELLDMANKAINKVESKIINLNQDYFLENEELAVVAGQASYDLPESIYASKLRRLFQTKGTTTKKLFRIKDLDATISNNSTQYLILNSATGRKIKLFPTPSEDSTIEIYFTRNARELTLSGGDSQLCDIPEYAHAVLAYMSYLVEFKDKSPTTPLAKQDYMEQIQEMTETLATGIDDEDNSIEPDAEFYLDSTGGY
jgi:hypothetical protein